MIVFAEGWCLMDDTRAVLVSYVRVHKYAESPILVLRKVRQIFVLEKIDWAPSR